MTVIDLEGVTRIYHVGDIEVQALAGVDLRVESGEFLALMGASGSGKSTMLNILGCLDRPSSGRYRFEGVDVAERSEPELARIRSDRIGFVFQSFNLLARTTAVENVALPLFYAANGPASRSERRALAWKALAALGLAARELNTPSQLSGGQQQRVAIARALINVPGVILADEPTGNLDSRTSKEIMELLRELNRDHGVTIISPTILASPPIQIASSPCATGGSYLTRRCVTNQKAPRRIWLVWQSTDLWAVAVPVLSWAHHGHLR